MPSLSTRRHIAARNSLKHNSVLRPCRVLQSANIRDGKFAESLLAGVPLKNAARRCPSEAVPGRLPSCGDEKQTPRTFAILAGPSGLRPANIGDSETPVHPHRHHGEPAKLTRRPPGWLVRDLLSFGSGSGVKWKQTTGAGAALGEDGIVIVGDRGWCSRLGGCGGGNRAKDVLLSVGPQYKVHTQTQTHPEN